MSETDQVKRRKVWEDYIMEGSVRYVRGATLRNERTGHDSKINKVIGHCSSTEEVNGK